MNQNYPKHEKLKSKKIIDLLFAKSQTVTKYPLRLVYVPLSEEDYTYLKNQNSDLEMIQIGVSVSKKYFKKAVDRNYFKRVLRECYRKNKHLLIDKLDKPHAFMFFYQSKDRLTYKEIEEKTIQLFEKFSANKDK